MKTKWTINAADSDVLIKMRHSTIAYLGGTSQAFDGFVDLDNNEISDASVAFSLNVGNKENSMKQLASYFKLNDLFDVDQHPTISFKSTSFQKINKNINFFKGDLTIRDITRVVELEAEFIESNTLDGNKKVAFEVKGDIKRQDFGLDYNAFHQNGGLALGKDIKLIANFEFRV